jgi:hypothetical protein
MLWGPPEAPFTSLMLSDFLPVAEMFILWYVRAEAEAC